MGKLRQTALVIEDDPDTLLFIANALSLKYHVQTALSRDAAIESVRQAMPDLIVVDWPGAMTYWLENPRGKAATWKQHTLTPVTNTTVASAGSPSFWRPVSRVQRRSELRIGLPAIVVRARGSAAKEPSKVAPTRCDQPASSRFTRPGIAFPSQM